MNERELLKELARDVQSAAGGNVVYLEGKTDVPILLGLLSAGGEQAVTGGVLYEGVLIRGLRDRRGSGSTAVSQRIAVAQRHGYSGILGVLDGDGAALVTLASDFDAPHAGPRFRWKAYCIENLLVRAGWPGAWGPAPDWREVMRSGPGGAGYWRRGPEALACGCCPRPATRTTATITARTRRAGSSRCSTCFIATAS